MALSDSSSLSSPPSSDDEEELPKAKIVTKTLKLKGGKLTAASVDTSPLSSPEPLPPTPTREPSPPHEYVLADNPDISFLVMFRSRFSEVFPKNVPNLGPQDIENGIVGSVPGEQMENFLCALLSLVLNRKKNVESGHYGRALEEAISTQKHQWPKIWGGQNPLPGTRTFSDMDPTERLSLLKTLVLWALNTSEAVSNIIKESHKQTRHDDDLNQPLSVQPWGSDGRKRKYWLIEGQNDTPFRLYRENAPQLVHRTWWSVAENLDELKAVGEALRAENTQAGRRLADSIIAAIPRLEATLEKRKRKEYRQARRGRFTRPELGFSLYEGRTRGKRMKYTFSDDEEDTSDVNSVRRSTRHSNGSTPAEVGGSTVTSSGRQVRSRFGRSYGDPMHQTSEAENGYQSKVTHHASGRPRRSMANDIQQGTESGSRTDDEMSDGNDDDAVSSGEEWDGNDDDVEGKFDEDDTISDDASDNSLTDQPRSLIVILKYRKNGSVSTKLKDGISEVGHGMSESFQDVQQPSNITEQNHSTAHPPQHSLTQVPEISKSASMPLASPDSTIAESKGLTTSPANVHHQEENWHPSKPQVPTITQSLQPVQTPPPFSELPPQSLTSPTVAQVHHSHLSNDMQKAISMTTSRSDQQSPMQKMNSEIGHGIPPFKPVYSNGYSVNQTSPSNPSSSTPKHQKHFDGYNDSEQASEAPLNGLYDPPQQHHNNSANLVEENSLL